MTTRVLTVQIEVEVPTDTDESVVESALNAALDEPPCDWQDWTVGGVKIVDVKVKHDSDND